MFYIFLFIIGSAIGSFLNVLIDRLPNEESIGGRSHCDYCKKQLPASVNIPIFSWFLLKGKTQCCGKPLSIQYPLIEFLTGLIFVLVWIYGSMPHAQIMNSFGDSVTTTSELMKTVGLKITYIGLLSTLLVIFVADMKYQIIPDSMQFLLLVFAIIRHVVETVHEPSLLISLRDGIIIMLPIFLLWLITKGRGMGFADVKLAFTIGVMFGIVGGFIALYIGFVTGGILGAILLLTKKKGLKSKIAFGPFLVLGIITMLFYGESILSFVHDIYPFVG